MSPLICLRCVLVDYPPPGLGARPRGHSRDDKIPPRLLLATLATRPPPLCPLSSPLSANGNCYSQSITINRGPQGLETRACNETNLWVVSQSQRRTQLGHCPGWKPFHITFIHFSHCYIMMLKRRPNGVSRHDVARTGEGPSGGFAEGSLRALVDRDNGEIVVVLPRLVISCYLLPLLPSALASKLGQNWFLRGELISW